MAELIVVVFLYSNMKLSHLAALTGVHTVVKAGGHVAAHLTQQHHAVDFCTDKKHFAQFWHNDNGSFAIAWKIGSRLTGDAALG